MNLSKSPSGRRGRTFSLDTFSVDTWAVLLAFALAAAVKLGVWKKVPW